MDFFTRNISTPLGMAISASLLIPMLISLYILKGG